MRVPRRMKPTRFLTLVAVLVALAMTLGAAAVYLSVQYNKDQAAATAATCTKVNVVQAEIKATISRQRAALASNGYFKKHPTELARALIEIRRELKVFSPLKC